MNRESILFNGGINNLIEPHLIQENEAPYVADCYIHSGSLESAKAPVENLDLSVSGQHATYFKADDEVVSSTEDRFYVEWAGFLYWSSGQTGDKKLKRYKNGTVNDIGGHVPPNTAPSLAVDGAGLLDGHSGDYSYTYTYVYDEVFETAPAPIATLSGVTNNAVKISGFPTSGLTPAPTHIRIYRSGGLNPTFNRVEQIKFGTAEYKDNTSDFRISRKELSTGTNEAPPEGLDMLVESSGTLFGAVGNKVHFSREGQPEFWSSYNYVQLPTECTGLGVIGDTVIAFTEENMFTINGRNVYDITLNKLPFSYGCSNKRTVQNIGGTLIWLAKQDLFDLLCAFDGGGVTVLNHTNKEVKSATVGSLTYDYFLPGAETYDDFTFNVINSFRLGRRYLLFLTGRTVVMDMESGFITYYMREEVLGAFEYHNEIHVIKKVGADYKPFKYIASFAPRRNMSYITKDYFDGNMTQEKDYRKIHVNATGKWGIAVYVDSSLVFDFDSSQGSTIHLPAGIHGKMISLSIRSEGYTVIKAIDYEYEPLRQGYTTVAPPMPPHCEQTFGGINGTAWHMAFTWSATCPAFKQGA